MIIYINLIIIII